MRPLAPSPGGIPLAFARTPFAKDVHRDTLPFGLTVAEVLQEIPELPDRAWTHGVVSLAYVIDGQAHCDPVPREWWGLIRLTEKPVPVTFTLHVPLGLGGRSGSGGGGARKSTFALVASIALVAATAAVSGGALAPLVGGGFLTAGSTSATLAAAGIGIAGGLAISALSPPPTFDRGGQQEDDRTSGSASASGNQLEPGGVIPRVIGTFRASPSFASLPLVDIDGDDEVVEAVFAMAGPHEWDNIRIDGVPIGSDHAYSSQTKEGWDDDTPLTMVTRQGFTDTPTLELSEQQVDLTNDPALKDQATPANSLPQWHTFITRRFPDEVWLSLLFPEGMIFADESDRVMIIPIRLRMRPRGTSTWINLPELHFKWRGGSAFKKAIKLKWIDDPNPSLPEPEAQFAPVYAFKSVPTQTATPTGIGGWTADGYFSAGAGDDVYSAATFATTKVLNVGLFYDRAEFYLGSKTDPFGAFSGVAITGETLGTVWEIQVMRGSAYRSDAFNPANYHYTGDGDIHDFFGYYDLSGTHCVIENTQNDRSKIVVTRVASVWNEHPIGGTGLALLAIKARNKAVQNVSALLKGYVPDWTGSAWSNWTTTSNPAPHYRYILAGGVNADPLPEELVDDDALVAWRTRCAADNLRCDMIADGRNADELLKVVASCGFARPRQSEVWGVIQDYDRSGESPVQIFTPRNLARFSYQKTFPLMAHGFRVRYRDRDRDYEDAPALTVYDEGYSADGAGDTIAAERLEEITYDGLTAAAAASDRAAFDLAQARLRSTFYTAEADAEALVATRGDLVGVQHDILAQQAGFARIKEKILDSGDVIGLKLDSKIPTVTSGDFFSIPDLFTYPDVFALTAATGIAIRMKDGTGLIIAHDFSDLGYVDELTFNLPFADPGPELDEGCLIASGALGSEYRRLILFDVQPAADLRASLTFVDEAQALWPPVVDVGSSFDGSFDSSFD